MKNPKIRVVIAVALLLGVGIAAYFMWQTGPSRTPPSAWTLSPRQRDVAVHIVAGAKAEAARLVLYDARYRAISYPGGDVPAHRGACTDVVIRALRHAGCDLQVLIHDDMKRHFVRYPHRYGLNAPDPNIDHRRIANHIVFLRHYGLELPRSTSGSAASTWQPGDLVYWEISHGQTHCGVLTDVRNGAGLPLVIHNLGVARQEDCLTAWKIIGHFRYPVAKG